MNSFRCLQYDKLVMHVLTFYVPLLLYLLFDFILLFYILFVVFLRCKLLCILHGFIYLEYDFHNK